MRSTDEAFEAFLERTGSDNATLAHFRTAFEHEHFARWTREEIVDSFVEWYDGAKRGDPGTRSALAAIESFLFPRAWVTLVALADREGT